MHINDSNRVAWRGNSWIAGSTGTCAGAMFGLPFFVLWSTHLHNWVLSKITSLKKKNTKRCFAERKAWSPVWIALACNRPAEGMPVQDFLSAPPCTSRFPKATWPCAEPAMWGSGIICTSGSYAERGHTQAPCKQRFPRKGTSLPTLLTLRTQEGPVLTCLCLMLLSMLHSPPPPKRECLLTVLLAKSTSLLGNLALLILFWQKLIRTKRKHIVHILLWFWCKLENLILR